MGNKLLNEKEEHKVNEYELTNVDERIAIEELHDVQAELEYNLGLVNDGVQAITSLEAIDPTLDGTLILYNEVCFNVGLEAVETISNEGIKETIDKILDVLKKAFYKVINIIKKMYVKIFKSSKVLNNNLKTLKERINVIANDSKAGTFTKEDIEKINSLTASFSLLNPITDKEDLIKKLKELIDVITRYKGSADAVKAIKLDGWDINETEPNVLNMSNNILKKINEHEKKYNSISNQLTISLISTHKIYNKDSKEKDISALVTLVDTKKIGGIVTIDNETKFVKYNLGGSPCKNCNESFTKTEILDLIVYINDIEKSMKVLTEQGNQDIDAADTLYSALSKMDTGKNSVNDENLKSIFKFVNNVVPNVANTNVISYYNTIRNIINILHASANKLEEVK